MTETKLFEVTDDAGKLYGWTIIRGEETVGIVHEAKAGGYNVAFNDHFSDHCWTLDAVRELAMQWEDSRITQSRKKAASKLNRLQERILALAIEIGETEGIDEDAKQAIDNELATARTAVICAEAFAANKRSQS